jgi:uncharacterized membrane protein
MSGHPEWRSAAFTGAGAILVALGVFVSAGWPFVLGGFVLLLIAAGSR